MKKSYQKLMFLLTLPVVYVVYAYFYTAHATELKLSESTKTHESGRVEVVLTSPSGEKMFFYVETALNDAERQKGLMFRTEMKYNEGMLFVWKDKMVRNFWMKNTYIPLDLIFMDDWKVVGVVQYATPRSLDPLTVPHLANAVLEIHAGLTHKYNITEEWTVSYTLNSDID